MPLFSLRNSYLATYRKIATGYADIMRKLPVYHTWTIRMAILKVTPELITSSYSYIEGPRAYESLCSLFESEGLVMMFVLKIQEDLRNILAKSKRIARKRCGNSIDEC